MSVNEPPQFTPAQVLEAGHRAEAEGRAELAQRFYRHLADNFVGTLEAVAAQNALRRLDSGPSAGPPTRPLTDPPAASSGLRNGHPPGVRSGMAYDAPAPDYVAAGLHGPAASFQQAPANRFEATRVPEPPLWPWQDQQPPSTPATPPTEPHYEAPPAIYLPDPPRDYRTGRVLARLLTWLGAMMAVSGIALVPIAVLSPHSLQALPVVGAWAVGPVLGGVLIAAGLLQVMFGQTVRAVLEGANAARDAAALARAKAEADVLRTIPKPGRGRRR